MLRQMYFYIKLAVTLFCVQLVCADYLQEAPAFLKPCSLHGVKDAKCLPKNMQGIFSNWAGGVPGLRSLGSIDPFHVKKLRLQQRTEGVVDIQLELKNAVIIGMKDINFKKTTISEKDYTFNLDLSMPLTKILGDYKIKGRMFLLNLNGQGKLNLKLENVDADIVAKTKLIQKEGQYFFSVQSINTHIKKLTNFNIHFGNLFNGNKDLEDSAHQLFNSNWSTLFEALQPSLQQTLDAIILDRFKKIFDYVPASYFVSDLP